MAIDSVIHTNHQSIDRVLRAGVPVLLVFWHKSAAPSAGLIPDLSELAARYAGRALIAMVDAVEENALVDRFGVSRLPTLVFTRGGAVEGTVMGALPVPSIADWLQYLIAGGAKPGSAAGPSVPIPGQSAQPRSTYSNGRGPASQPRPAHTNGRGPASQPQQGPVVLTDATFQQAVQTSRPVLVDFWAPWCGPCRMVAPAVEELAREFQGRATVAKLNVDENPQTAQRYGIMSIPALYVFRNGNVVERVMGAQSAHVLRQALARHVA